MGFFEKFLIASFIAFVCMAIFATRSSAKSEEFNYDESKVPAYELPDPLTCSDGSKVTSAELWINKRRTEIDFINGKFVEYGKQAGIETPYNNSLRTLVKGLESAIEHNK